MSTTDKDFKVKNGLHVTGNATIAGNQITLGDTPIAFNATTNKLELYMLSGNSFEKNLGNLKKVIENRKTNLDKLPNNKLYGYLKYEKG